MQNKDDKKAKRKLEPTNECRVTSANNANFLFELVRNEWGKLINTEVYHQSLLENMR
jgi:hypothetical protein